MKKHDIYSVVLPKTIYLWVLQHIKHPIQGYEHKKNIRGNPITKEEQISLTQFQVLLIASDYYQKGASQDRIFQVLSYFDKAAHGN